MKHFFKRVESHGSLITAGSFYELEIAGRAKAAFEIAVTGRINN